MIEVEKAELRLEEEESAAGRELLMRVGRTAERARKMLTEERRKTDCMLTGIFTASRKSLVDGYVDRCGKSGSNQNASRRWAPYNDIAWYHKSNCSTSAHISNGGTHTTSNRSAGFDSFFLSRSTTAKQYLGTRLFSGEHVTCHAF